MEITVLSGIELPGNRYQATSNTDWGDLGSSPYSSWANWTRWDTSPGNIQLRIDIDTDTVAQRAPIIAIPAEGSITVSLKITSAVTTDSNGVESGTFGGEETTINFVNDGTEYSYVAGRFYRWTITVSADSNTLVPLLSLPQASFYMEETQETYEAVNTATLSGTIDARVINSNIDVVKTLIATAQEEGTTYSSGLLRDRVYAVPDDYVFQENSIIVNVVSKSPPTIRCFDLNGESIDAVVDVIIRGLPKIKQDVTGIIIA